MKFVLPGGTGHLGTILARALGADGHEVVVLSRTPRRALDESWRVETWDGTTLGPWTRELDGADVVINLAGRSVNCRYTPENRRAILDSRVLSTRVVGQAIAEAKQPPRTWLQMGTATIYSHRLDAPNDERTGRIDPAASPMNYWTPWSFSVGVARAWEDALFSAAVPPRTRRVALRQAMVMSPERGGIFDVLLALVRRGLGGTVGDGRQRVSWIHEQDFVRAVKWLVEHEELEGPINVVSPGALPNAEFMRILRRAWDARVGLPAAGWVLEFGTCIMRTEAELVLKSRWVAPTRLLESGFRFEWPDWGPAAANLCVRVRATREGLVAA